MIDMRSSRLPPSTRSVTERNQPLLRSIKDQKARLEGASARESYPRCDSSHQRGGEQPSPGRDVVDDDDVKDDGEHHIDNTLLLHSYLIDISLFHEPLTKTKCSSS
jgi:hypothetical protein